MTFRKKKGEDGSAAVAGIASLATLALATMMVQQTSLRTKGSLDAAKEARGREASNIGADNSLARFRSLITPRLQGDGTYVPTVFASNYYSASWKLMEKSGAKKDDSFNFSPTNSGVVKAGKQDLSDKDLKALMSGSALKAMGQWDSFSIDVIKPNFEEDSTKPGYRTLVTSVDVKVRGKALLQGKSKETSVSARVGVVAPKPYNSKIMYRKQGTSDPLKEVKDDEDLSGGTFDFYIVSSGVAFEGVLLVDGKEVSRSVGFDAAGNITHKAVNYEAKDVPISEAIPLKLEAEKPDNPPASGGGGANEVDDGDSFNAGTCTYVPSGGGGGGGGGAGGGGMVVTGSVTGTKTMQAIVYGPDGTTKDETKEFKVKAEAPAPPGGAPGGQTNDGNSNLSQSDYANLCAGESECTWVPTDSGNGAELGRVASYFRPTGDISSYYTFKQGQDPGKWGIFKKKVCFNFSKADNSSHNLQFSEAIVVVYNTSNCTKKNLFTRTSCGCVTADTRILLGDGVTEKRIDEIVDQDTVWNPILKKAFPIRLITRGPEKIPMIALSVGDRSIQATGYHPFNARRGLVPAFDLKVGDEILIDGVNYAPITKIDAIPVPEGSAPPVVWNIEIDAPDDDHDAHHLVANGITTGDLMIQKKLQSGLIR